MTKDDAASRKARAEGIHRQIEDMKARKGAPSSTPSSVPETPAGFIHRRMQELELKAKKNKPK